MGMVSLVITQPSTNQHLKCLLCLVFNNTIHLGKEITFHQLHSLTIQVNSCNATRPFNVLLSVLPTESPEKIFSETLPKLRCEPFTLRIAPKRVSAVGHYE